MYPRSQPALQKQITRDVAPIWEISATVDSFDKLEDVPLGYWQMVVRDDIDQPGAAGIHLTKDNQPFALITAADDINAWSLTASHEAIEMLVDPFGNRLMAGDSPAQGQGRVEFLVEACDPSEAKDFGYTVNEILVSDFYTPRYFDPQPAPDVRYSFTGHIERPRTILRGGYLSWHDHVSDHWFQLTWFSGDIPRVRDIGQLTAKGESLRAQIDRVSEAESQKVLKGTLNNSSLQAKLTMSTVGSAAASRADKLRAQIGQIVGGPANPPRPPHPRPEPSDKYPIDPS